MTQTPDYVFVSLGDTAIISCSCSSSIGQELHWYQQKPGQPPKLLISYITTRQPGVPDRFSGSGSETEFKLTIRGVIKDDAASYLCIQKARLPFTQ
ncbi:hypothetical protein GDO78_014211 [Eleutherodactylus coqui]|uniref:Ig-like domain-containing protein n=1 Tax=Eleutherodactylus coqui TaxID=57060 RepID=A0A8J6BFQ1_ELECQ|nr:hypothetical protein GDO78_014211 [Eleutherodactylus coqui]